MEGFERTKVKVVRTPRWTSPVSFLPKVVFLAAIVALAPRDVVGSDNFCCADTDQAQDEDLFPLKVASEYSEDWDVIYGPNYKLVSIAQGKQTLVLYNCGTNQPDKASLPSEYQTNTTKWIQIPVTRVALADTTSVTYFERLGARDTLVSVSSFTTSACVAKEVDNNVTRYATSTEVQSAEYYQTLNLDLAVFDAFTLSSNPDLQALPYSVLSVASSDPGLIQRAEWVEFFSLFLNQERVGLSISSLVRERILLSAALSERTSRRYLQNQRRVTAWMTYFSFNGSSFWSLSTAAYLWDPSEGAFGYALCDNGASRFSFLALSGNDNPKLWDTMCGLDLVFFSIFDIDFYTSFVDEWSAWVTAQGPDYKCIPIQRQRVYSDDKTLGPDGVSTDVFESSLADSDQFSADIVWAVFEDVLGEGPDSLERRYIRNFMTETRNVQTAADCDESDFEASQYRANGCFSNGLPGDIEFDFFESSSARLTTTDFLWAFFLWVPACGLLFC